MKFNNLAELKEQYSAASGLDAAKSALYRTQLSTLYRFLYTNAQFRLGKIAEKLHRLYPLISEEQMKENLTLGDVCKVLCENPPPCPTNIAQPHPEYDDYLAILFELVFLPIYIIKNS